MADINPITQPLAAERDRIYALEDNQATGILDLDELETSFDSNDHYDTEYNNKYDVYAEGMDKLEAENDKQGAADWTNRFNQYKEHRNYYQGSYDCTFTGECDAGTDILKHQAEEWRYDDMVNNEPLLKSLRRTYDAYNYKGELRSDESLIKKFMTDQTHLEYNFTTGKALTMANLMASTDQQKDDLALQYLTYTKIKGTGEGSRDTAKQTFDVVGALVTDPLNYGGVGVIANLVKLAGGKTVGKEVTKSTLKDFFADRIKSRVAKSTLTGMGIGSGYMGFDALAKEDIVMSAGLQKEVNWEKVGTHTAMGAVFGGSFGALVGGASKAFNSMADRYMIKNGWTNQQMLEDMSSSVKDPRSLSKWLKKLGWDKDDAKNELRFLEEEGFNFNKETGLWQNKAGNTEYKTPLMNKNTERGHFGGEVDERIIPKGVQRKGEEVIDENYIDVQNIDIPISFSKSGQKAFDRLDNALGARAVQTIYGGDAILVRSGLRKEATALGDAMAATDINVSRMSHKLQSLVAKNEAAIGDVNKLVRDRLPANNEQKLFLKELDALKDNQMRMAFKNKVISAEDYQRFLKDRSYIPRVWNSQHLLTDEGSAEFSRFISQLWKKDAPAARDIIEHIAGKKSEADSLINAKFAPNRIKDMFRNKADREIDVHRSSHLEHERKLKVAEKYEPMLDQFMAKPLDRWSKFFEDIVKRNEFARRFGAKDQKIHKKIKKLEDQGKHKAAEHLKEYYFTTMGDARFSKTVQSKIENPALMKGVGKINAFQNLKLGLAALPNATQAFVQGTVKMTASHGLLKAPFKAVSAIVRSMVKTNKDMDIINRAGVLGEMDLSKIATENMPHARIFENEFKGPLKYFNESTKFLRAVGFMSVEEMNRRAAAIMAHGHVATIHSKLQVLKSKGKGAGKQARRAEKELKELGINDPHKSDLSAKDYAISGHIFNKQINFSGESFNIPTNWQTPWFKLMTKFKSFMYYQARFLKRQVADELFIHHNPKPLLAYMVAGGIAGNAVDKARALLTGKEIDDNKNALQLVINGIGNAGGGGLWWDTMKSVADQGPAGAFNAVMGPTASDLANTIQDVSQGDINSVVKRLLPNIPGKHQLMDSLKY